MSAHLPVVDKLDYTRQVIVFYILQHLLILIDHIVGQRYRLYQ